MATLTIRMPDDKHSRLKALAQHRHVSVNKLIEELSTQALAEFDSEVRFRLLTSSYSENNALLIKGLYFPCKHRLKISRLGPLVPIRALMRTLVSITTPFILIMIAYMQPHTT